MEKVPPKRSNHLCHTARLMNTERIRSTHRALNGVVHTLTEPAQQRDISTSTTTLLAPFEHLGSNDGAQTSNTTASVLLDSRLQTPTGQSMEQESPKSTFYPSSVDVSNPCTPSVSQTHLFTPTSHPTSSHFPPTTTNMDIAGKQPEISSLYLHFNIPDVHSSEIYPGITDIGSTGHKVRLSTLSTPVHKPGRHQPMKRAKRYPPTVSQARDGHVRSMVEYFESLNANS